MKPLYTCLLLSALTFSGCDGSRVTRPPASRVLISDVMVGTGAAAEPGDTLTVLYEGWLTDSTKIASTRGKPFWFVLGTGQVVRGWDLGLPGMRESGIRRLVVPPDLAYGEEGVAHVVPPNATLVFEIELLEVRASRRLP